MIGTRMGSFTARALPGTDCRKAMGSLPNTRKRTDDSTIAYIVLIPKLRPRIIQAIMRRKEFMPKYQMSTDIPVTILRRADAPVRPPSIILFGRRNDVHAITNSTTPTVMTR